MPNFVPISFLLLYFLNGCGSQSARDDGPFPEFQVLEEDIVYGCCDPGVSRELPRVYCHLGVPKGVFYIWRTVSVLVDLPPDQYSLFVGRVSNEVLEQFEIHTSSWIFDMLSEKERHINIDPFNSTFLGIKTDQDYTIKLEVVQVNYLSVAIFSLGVLLFFLSPHLAGNTLLYYLMGTCTGVLASVLVLIYLFLKLLPLKRSVILGMVAGGSTLAFYFAKVCSDHIFMILVDNQEYVLAYLMLSALISFIVCYRIGPMTDPRSRNLVSWFLQAISLAVIYFSSHLREFTLTVDILLLSVSKIPFRWVAHLQRMISKSPPSQLALRDRRRRIKDYKNYQQCLEWQEVCQKLIAGEGACHRLIEEIEELRRTYGEFKPVMHHWSDFSESD